MSKISELSDGGVIQGGDTLIAVRSGGNVKVTYGGTTTANIDGGTIDGTTIGGTTPAAGSFTTGSFTGDVSFGDNDKAIFGAGSDLQIYHDGTHSYVSDQGTGNLRVLAENFQVRNPANNEAMIIAIPDSGVTLYHDNSTKLSTTATGIDVTGSVTADGLTVDGNIQLDGNIQGETGRNTQVNAGEGTGDKLDLRAGDDVRIYVNGKTTHKLGASFENNGDISFYESTGTTPKFFWDSSAESLGIGTSSPQSSQKLHIANTSGNCEMTLQSSDSGVASLLFGDATDFSRGKVTYDNSSDSMAFQVNNLQEAMRISGSGKVGIGVSSNLTGTLNLPNDGVISFHDAGGNARNALQFSSGELKHGAAGAGLSTQTFYTSGSEAMRIDASGNLLVGTTNTANIASAAPNVVTDKSYGINDTVNKTAFQIDRINFDSSSYYVLNASAIGVRLNNGATAWTTQSDETLKENITELTGVLSKVQNLRCVSYNLKSQNADDVKLGFIAQDWQTEFPEVVHDEPSDGTLGINYTETIPVLLKAIQEQTEIINDLRARVAQLEGVN